MPKHVIAVGIAVMDKIFRVAEMPREATKAFARSYAEIGGGPASTGAVTVARLGGVAELWSRVGDDAVGRRIVEELRESGVEPRIRHVAGRVSSVSSVLVDDRGERLVVAFTDPQLDADASWLPLTRLETADALLADLRWPQASLMALRRARAAGVPSVLDADLAPDEVVRMLLPLPDYALFAEPALRRLTGKPDPADGAIRHAPGYQVEAVDTLGAGDVFHGAFALAVAEGRSVQAAAGFANAAAALKCSRPGGRAGIPTRAEVEALCSAERRDDVHRPRA